MVYICPKATDIDELAKTYKYATEKCKDLNIKPNEISVKADAEHLDVAQELVEYMEDEFDAEVEPAEVF